LLLSLSHLLSPSSIVSVLVVFWSFLLSCLCRSLFLCIEIESAFTKIHKVISRCFCCFPLFNYFYGVAKDLEVDYNSYRILSNKVSAGLTDREDRIFIKR
jgi:hypothetical protein